MSISDRRFFVIPYRQGSKSAAALAGALGGRVLLLKGSKYKHRPWSDTVINWGCTDVPDPPGTASVMSGLMNKPAFLRFASNKLNFFRLMKERDLSDVVPEWWEKGEDIPDTAFPIVCRTVLAGHSGEGIVIVYKREDLVPAPLYVKYVRKQDEYRIHVGKKGEENGVISVQRKARRLDCETPDWKVRNHQNGFVYVRNDVTPPDAVLAAATQAFGVTGLDFGAVDVIWNEHGKRAYVLEVNTAPGLEGQTVTDYAKFFKGDE